VSVFIEDPTAFGGESDECIFSISGMDIVSDNIGSVPYTSLDSIVNTMVACQYDYRFRLDNYYMIAMANKIAGGQIYNLAPIDATTKASNPDYPYIDCTATAVVTNAYGNDISGVDVKNRQQGKAALEVFSIVIGDMNYVTAYNISAYNIKGSVKKTSTPVQYTMTIPAAYQYPGRQFSLIQLGEGVVNILADEDDNDTTITFTTDYGTTSYALCYTD
jgi:hypothetical protein